MRFNAVLSNFTALNRYGVNTREIIMMKTITFMLFSTALWWLTTGAAKAQTDALFVVHFETGPAWQQEVAPNEQAGFLEHAANLNRLRQAGVIKFGARYDRFGMIVIGADDLQAATKLMDEDPGVVSGLFVHRTAPMKVFFPWQDQASKGE